MLVNPPSSVPYLSAFQSFSGWYLPHGLAQGATTLPLLFAAGATYPWEAVQSSQAEQPPEEPHIPGTEGPAERGVISSCELSLFRSAGRKLSTWPNRLAQELMESSREMNNAAKKQHRAPGSGAKAGKSERSRDPQRSCSHSQALLGSCLSDPAALLSLDCKWYFPYQCCTHCASGRRQEPFCSFPMETTEIQAQHPQGCPGLSGEELLTCRCSASAVREGICR